MKSVLLAIKPLSVNDAYKGRRFSTPEHKSYKKNLMLILPKKYQIPHGKLKIKLEFGFSSAGSDGDNPIKPLIDVLQKKYNFNDNRIYRYEIDKVLIKKGFEYVKFSIESMN